MIPPLPARLPGLSPMRGGPGAAALGGALRLGVARPPSSGWPEPRRAPRREGERAGRRRALLALPGNGIAGKKPSSPGGPFLGQRRGGCRAPGRLPTRAWAPLSRAARGGRARCAPSQARGETSPLFYFKPVGNGGFSSAWRAKSLL